MRDYTAVFVFFFSRVENFHFVKEKKKVISALWFLRRGGGGGLWPNMGLKVQALSLSATFLKLNESTKSSKSNGLNKCIK